MTRIEEIEARLRAARATGMDGYNAQQAIRNYADGDIAYLLERVRALKKVVDHLAVADTFGGAALPCGPVLCVISLQKDNLVLLVDKSGNSMLDQNTVEMFRGTLEAARKY